MKPGTAGGPGLPFCVTKTALASGLNRTSVLVSRGPIGGVLVLSLGKGRRESAGWRPLSETEKHATPFLAPPKRTHAGDTLSELSDLI